MLFPCFPQDFSIHAQRAVRNRRRPRRRRLALGRDPTFDGSLRPRRRGCAALLQIRRGGSKQPAYHWLQGAAYDVQLMGDSAKQRELLKPVIAHYHGYLRNRRFPEAAATFDNLHMLHDNMDDVLMRPDLYPSKKDKREAILKILPIYVHRNHAKDHFKY